MTPPSPAFTVDVDVTNPGQFFACCGLLELAHRLWPGSEGWFEEARFHVAASSGGDRPLETLLVCLKGADVLEVPTRGDRDTRAVMLQPCGVMLDWWLDSSGARGPLKVWAGQQTTGVIFGKLCRALSTKAGAGDLFHSGEPLKGRLGVDPRPAWNAQDVGFSPNTLKYKVMTSAAVELLAAIGLQGHRPLRVRQAAGRSFTYVVWYVPLPVCVTRAVAGAAVWTPGGSRFEFGLTQRGSYKGFGWAKRIGGSA